jgi:hypothetical protein
MRVERGGEKGEFMVSGPSDRGEPSPLPVGRPVFFEMVYLKTSMVAVWLM